ncbi:MAG: Membrane protein insertase YidC [Candidatus Nomurabacteria bacterium GW2011_GWF2_43_8]|uniref:Membrane protein insertase YidC n=2 Tax=Candidatus Nomuraibacteriota TaxID=1752729 RepID=A0A0G1FS54_9BACT|nr:MAG: Membrane protein insertase YidC [Candidatus Nomurabacteria bacterium GW2011_GWA2_43_15]KKT24898.1 MAG: Membrane protein insertase YidC [Candidatus Nomurabacteria bacterium GW2011_GWF2_43_8]
MLGNIWNLVLYQPLLNALAVLVSVIPNGDVGIAVVVLTIIVKLILLPLSHKSIESQARMNILTPELNKIKASGASKEEQARLTFDLYKKNKTNPFSGCLLVLIQIPIIFALYYVFLKGINFEGSVLYSFIPTPGTHNMVFLGLIDITSKSALLAILAGVSQYLQAHFMPKPAPSPTTPGTGSSFQESFTKSMSVQMKYIFPFIVAFIAYSISGAVALYWITSNLFMVGQQIYIKKKEFTPVTK